MDHYECLETTDPTLYGKCRIRVYVEVEQCGTKRVTFSRKAMVDEALLSIGSKTLGVPFVEMAYQAYCELGKK
jgi:predicted thioesterase